VRENDEQYDRPAKVPQGCLCGDLPGQCPGRSQCPACQPEVEVRTCPKCFSGDYNQHFHEYDVNQAGSQADCSWWRCEDCGSETEPE
jgi:hypothetical protein